MLSAIFMSSLSAGAETDQPKVERTAVVTGQGYFPVACRLQGGRIAAVLRGGAPHIGIKGRLDMVFSEDEGKTWSKPTVVADHELDDRNPAFGQAKDGTLVVGYWLAANYHPDGKWDESLKKSSTWVTRSPDGGKTWSKPSQIDVSDLEYGSPYGKIVTMPDGAMLMPIYGSGISPKGAPRPEGDFSYLYRSTDDGQTWARFSTIGAARFNETSVLRLDSGDLLAAMRTVAPDQDVWLTSSKDGGKTWSAPKKLTPAMVHPADLVQLPDGRVLLVAGDRRNPYGVRGVIGTAETLDWANSFLLSDSATHYDCGYPSSVVLKDGRVVTIYYAIGDKEHADWGTHAAALTFTPPK
jgi:hypothetical protein